MKKLFISQPMRGKTKEEIEETRERVIETAKNIFGEVEVIESYFSDYNPENGCIPLKYLSASINLLADADIAYFAEGFDEARGCLIEEECARKYGIPTAFERNGDTIIVYQNTHEYDSGSKAVNPW